MNLLNLSIYKLIQVSELDRWMNTDIDRYMTFHDRVFTFLDSIRIGQKVSVMSVCKPESYELFIKLCCMYMNLQNMDGSYLVFDNDNYTVLWRQWSTGNKTKYNINPEENEETE